MKKIFVFLLFLLFLGACRNSPKGYTNNVAPFNRDSNIVRRSFPPSQYVPTTVKLLELKKEYYTMFDSVVFKSITDSFNRTKKIGFEIGIRPLVDGSHNISIHPVEYRFMSIHLDDAVFYFNGFQFNYSGDLIEEMFTYKKDTVLCRVDPDLWYQYDMVSGGDEWRYMIKNGEVLFINKSLFE